MSSTKDSTEDQVDTSNVGGLEEIIPEPLMPAWRRIELIQQFRETHGDTYVTVLEVLTALVLGVGYAWWAYIYFFGSDVVTI
ncbi:hypothetical protein [Halorubrum cibi]|uniref:Uncharacterized protein n=1 Tax=Halorubrum cibi TaxID=413815 RepID=A0A521B9L2_9EURY|nr:hypothetical protein [Halorubrum cibi]SMO43786.1 hypothetical protein SAMN06264867_102107 [Halorubrum cibi]